MKILGAAVSAIAIVSCGRIGFAPALSSDATDVDGTAQDALNCLGHDEDSDGVADSCDNCPATANLDQLDIGEVINGELPDGVGDACDPRPAKTDDFITFFDACDQPSANFAYFGTVSYSQDGTVLGSVLETGSAELAYRAKMTRSAVRIEIIEASTAVGSQWAGFWYRDSDTDSRGVLASVNRNVGTRPVSADLDETVPGLANNKSTPIAVAPELVSGMAFTLTIDTPRLTGGGDTLRLQSTNPFIDSMASVSLAPTDIIGKPYLEASMVKARIQYLIIYASQE